MFSPSFPQVERFLDAFDNAEIKNRNFCKPLSYYATPKSFQVQNTDYIKIALEYSVQAVEKCLASAEIQKADITDLIFISTTGLATPSLDALIINQMKLNPHINRIPVWGLGCGGGVSGVAKANMVAKSNPDAVVLLVAIELCSLTFLKNDFSKSNFIASSLFSDGIAACIVMGENHTRSKRVAIAASSSKLYYDSLDIMGWEFLDSGFKVIFSRDIPSFIHANILGDIEEFLTKQNLKLTDIKNFIFHPGGKKVLTAYEEALPVDGDFLKNSRETIRDYGNMSSGTVLYVLEKYLREGFTDGYGLMLAMGPGFSTEMVLLSMNNN